HVAEDVPPRVPEVERAVGVRKCGGDEVLLLRRHRGVASGWFSEGPGTLAARASSCTARTPASSPVAAPEGFLAVRGKKFRTTPSLRVVRLSPRTTTEHHSLRAGHPGDGQGQLRLLLRRQPLRQLLEHLLIDLVHLGAEVDDLLDRLVHLA